LGLKRRKKKVPGIISPGIISPRPGTISPRNGPVSWRLDHSFFRIDENDLEEESLQKPGEENPGFQAQVEDAP
jgi:hypothetical protein